MNRLIWADRLKGVLIILVVLGHAVQYTLGTACEDNHLWNLIYSFHMPAFVAVSGYLGYREGKRMVLSRRFRQLMVPFFVWSLILFLLNPPYQASSFLKFILYPDKSFWFLWVLFWIAFLFYVGDVLAEKVRVRQEIVIGVFCLALVALMILLNVRVLGIQFIAFYFLFYSLGYYFHKYDLLVTSNWVVLLILTTIWAILAWFWKMHDAPAFLNGFELPKSLLNYSYRFLTAIIAVYVLLCAAPQMLNYKSCPHGFLDFCGIWSLGIYVVHLLLMPYISSMLTHHLSDPVSMGAAFFFSLAASLLLVILLSKITLTLTFLLGKI